MTDFRKDIKEIIKDNPKQLPILLRIATELYRENGLTEVKYNGYLFTNKDILFSD